MISRQNIVLLVVSSSIFFEALDIAIVNLAIPLIQKDFALTSDTVQWMQTLYVLFYGGFLIIGGKLADMIGRKKIFMAGSALFLLTSLGAALSSSFAMLAAFRAFQGLGAALVMPSALSIITNTFTGIPARNKAIGIFGSFAAIGSGSGLSLGGLIATSLGWQWIFFINVPVIAITFILSWLYVTPDEVRPRRQLPDIASGILLTAIILMLTYVIHEVKNIEPHLFVVGVLILVCVRMFILRISKSKDPLIDFSLLNTTSTLTGNGVILLMGAFFTGYLFTISLILQSGMKYTALQAGLILFPFSVLSAIVSKNILPVILRRISMLQAGILGMLLMTLGAVALLVSLMMDFNMLFLLISVACVMGTGIAVCFTSLTVIAIQDVPMEHHGLASSIANTCFFFGGGIGLSVLSLFLDHSGVNQYNGQLPVIALGLFALCGVIWLLSRQRWNAFATVPENGLRAGEQRAKDPLYSDNRQKL